MRLAGDRPVMLNLKIQPQVVANGDGALIGRTTLDGTGSPLVQLGVEFDSPGMSS